MLKRSRRAKREIPDKEAEMGKRAIIGGGIAAVVAAAGFGGMAIAGDNGEREAGPRVVAEPMAATKAGPVTRAGGGAKIQTFYLQNEVVPAEGEGTVAGPKCPKGEGSAIGGGAATAEGIVVSYLSQIRPSNGTRSDRVYWVGVDDNAGDVGAGAIIEVHCAKGIGVKK
jgi:hypothetical protein